LEFVALDADRALTDAVGRERVPAITDELVDPRLGSFNSSATSATVIQASLTATLTASVGFVPISGSRRVGAIGPEIND